MATPATGAGHASPDHPITIKVAFNGNNRKFKLSLRDLNANTLPQKLRSTLQIPEEQKAVIERFSDSSQSYLVLDPANLSTYKQLYRAAKAKLKLRLRVTYPQSETKTASAEAEASLENPTVAMELPAEAMAVNTPKPLPEVLQPEPSTVPSPFSVPKAFKPLPEVFQPEPQSNPVPFGTIKAPRSEAVDQLFTKPHGNTRCITKPQSTSSFWQVYCNNCDKSLSDAHFHCGSCDNGDFDLCEVCVNAGHLCRADSHWLIKRFIKDGKIVNSTTEKVAPKVRDEAEPKIPGAFKSEAEPSAAPNVPKVPTRTCNNCIRVLPEPMMINCQDCADFDLCAPCVNNNRHGHHPGHTFKPLSETSKSTITAASKCEPGRGMKHAAICDRCDQTIYGVRHKCLNCPDWDCCDKCILHCADDHPGHRFVPIYTPLHDYTSQLGLTTHYGIFCDGPLCSGTPHQGYIRGDRFKCAICHDTDFCAKCEAHPSNKHNATHPLIKFKTQVRGVAVTTTGDDGRGQTLPTMGDRAQPEQVSSVRAAASVQTLPRYEQYANTEPALKSTTEDPTAPLDAHFIKEAVTDGTKFAPGHEFSQTWTLRNPGPSSWPAGSFVKLVGGDDMLAIDRTKNLAAEIVQAAIQSNVIGRGVGAGEQMNFNVKMKAPLREGKHISYWRLHDPKGLPFGHKLWCDIEVKSMPVPVLPAPLSAGYGLSTMPTIPQMQYSEQMRSRQDATRQMARLRQRIAASQAEHTKHAAAAAGKAWSSPPSVKPAPVENLVDRSIATSSAAQQQAISSDTAISATKATPTAPALMPVINNAARFAMPHQMRMRAMELQQRQRLLMSKLQGTQCITIEQRESIDRERTQLQRAMREFAAGYRPPPQSLVPAENAELRDLINKQNARRAKLMEGVDQSKSSEQMVANAQTDNCEMMELVTKQRQRRQALQQQNQAARQAQAEKAPAPTPAATVKIEGTEAPTIASANSTTVSPVVPAPTTSDKGKEAVRETAPISATHKAPTVEDIDEATMEKSDMVFPKLEKESPASSLELNKNEKDAAPASEAAEASKAPSAVSETTTAGAAVTEDDFESVTADDVDIYDDAPSSAGVQSEEDDGFDTDEYDILDASDEEIVEGKGF